MGDAIMMAMFSQGLMLRCKQCDGPSEDFVVDYSPNVNWYELRIRCHGEEKTLELGREFAFNDLLEISEVDYT